jgi:hypothetical protein
MRRFLKRLFLVLTAVLAVLILLCAGFLGWGQWRYHHTLAELREQGEPVLLTDLEAPSVPPEENGFEEWLQAWEILESEEWTRVRDLMQDLDFDQDEWTAEEQLKMKRDIAQSEIWSRLQQQLEKAVTKPVILIPRIQKSTEILYLTERLEFFNAMTRGIGVFIETGNAERAQDLLMLSVQLDQAMDAQPVLINLLVDIAQQALIVAQIEEGFRQGMPLNQTDIDVLNKWLTEARQIHFDNVVEHERLYMASILDDDLSKDRLKGLMLWFNLSRWHWLASFFDAYLKTCLPDTWGQMEEVLPQTKLLSYQRDGSLKTQEDEISFWNMVSPTLIPGFSSSVERADQHKARLQVTQVGLTLETIRRNTGSYPETLRTFPASLRTDPFTGDPLKYELSEGRPVIYSVGPNGRDDDGEYQYGSKSEQDDITWDLCPQPTVEQP